MISGTARFSSPAFTSDALGVGTSVLCVIHCLALPVITALLPGLRWAENELVHIVLVAVSGLVLIMASAHWPTHLFGLWLRLAGYISVLGLFAAAIASPSEQAETTLTVIAACSLALIHIVAHISRIGQVRYYNP